MNLSAQVIGLIFHGFVTFVTPDFSIGEEAMATNAVRCYFVSYLNLEFSQNAV